MIIACLWLNHLFQNKVYFLGKINLNFLPRVAGLPVTPSRKATPGGGGADDRFIPNRCETELSNCTMVTKQVSDLVWVDLDFESH